MIEDLKFETRRSVAKVCPCGRSNKDGKFAPFKGFTDKGHCHSCGETFFPGKEAEIKINAGPQLTQDKPISYLPFDAMFNSTASHRECSLYPYLASLFDTEIASNICNSYFIGAGQNGNTVFWYADVNGRLRQAKEMPYKQDGHRDHDRIIRSFYNNTGEKVEIKGAYATGKAILRSKEVNLQYCFFGEIFLHWLDNADKKVCIVESEKTAVIASVFYPEFVWLATGGKNGCKWTASNVCNVLANRDVILYPDVGAYDLWKEKGKLLSMVAGCKVGVSDLLEKYGKKNNDIADYLTMKAW